MLVRARALASTGMRRLGARLRGPAPVILMYHRVAEVAYDPWALAVSPVNFADQLRALAASREIVSMSTLVQRLRSGHAKGREVALTFDDGYLDNLTTAKPLLERAAAPATVFLTSERLGAREEFWWDELAHMCLGNTRAVDVQVEIDGQPLRVHWGAAPSGSPGTWHWKEPPPGDRERVYLDLWRRLRALSAEKRASALDILRERLGEAATDSEGLPMRRQDVAVLVASGLIKVGGHSRSHPALTSLASDSRHSEIAGCKDDLEQLTGSAIEGFAYPYGDRDKECKLLTERAGFAWAVSTHAAAVDPGHFDPFDLPRLAVRNTGGGDLLDMLAGIGRSA